MLDQAITDVIVPALAVALSPIPIVAIVLVLGTPRARPVGAAFALGWVVGLTAVSVVVVTAASGASDPDSATATGVNWLQVALGVVFLALALRSWRSRPQGDEEPEMPKWMSSIDHVSTPRAVGLGLLLSAANPKNLALTLSAAASIAQAGVTGADTVIAVAVFVAVASLTVVGAVVFSLVAPAAAAGPLARIKVFMAAHSALIMVVLLVIIGVKVLADGLGGALD